ncbi:MAG TPA: TPM domain-containing protein, partial [Thermoanaerobaculia bacterium]|nr:TPM domain-containing protein [Thermoanaerobaculia bacterium]
MRPLPAGLRLAAALVALLTLLVLPLAARDVPYLVGRVNDTAGMLSPQARQRIEAELATLEKETGAQVAVLTLDTLDGDPLEDFSVRVAKAWKLGQQGKDNGVLLLIVKNDRKTRIEVGYGLEPQLTDLGTHVILDEILRPAFQRGDFDGGVEKAVDAIASAVRGKGVPQNLAPAPEEGPSHLPAGPREGFSIFFLLILGVFSLVALSTRGFQSWFLYLFLTPFYYFLGGATLGLFLAGAWLVLFPILRQLFGRFGG